MTLSIEPDGFGMDSVREMSVQINWFILREKLVKFTDMYLELIILKKKENFVYFWKSIVVARKTSL